MIKDLRKAAPTLPRVLFVFQASVEAGKQLFDKIWPEAEAVADPDLVLYQAFERERGGLGQLFGPRVIAAGFRALFKGNAIGRPVGDVRVMPGMFLVSGSLVLWQHPFRHAGDHPDLATLPGVLAAVAPA